MRQDLINYHSFSNISNISLLAVLLLCCILRRKENGLAASREI